MIETEHQYAIEFSKTDGTPLGRLPIEPDWEPAEQWTRFLGIRRGMLPASRPAAAVVEPLWHLDLGEPHLRGFRVRLRADGNQEVYTDFKPAYFRQLALGGSSHLVSTSQLQAGESFHFTVVAYPGAQRPPPASARFSVETVAAPLPMKDSSLAEFEAQSQTVTRQVKEDMPLFIHKHVLEEAAALTRKAGAIETGGILIGRLHRDSSVPEVFAEVSGQIPAQHTRAALSRLTFTAQTWAAVDAALKLHKSRCATKLGWWHSHSYMKEVCKDCPKEKQAKCKPSVGFMSFDDCALHRACFPGPYSVALVVTDSPCSGLTWSLFGWRNGVVAWRGYRVLSPVPAASAAPDTAAR